MQLPLQRGSRPCHGIGPHLAPVYPAGRFMRWVLDSQGFAGIYTPGGNIYILPECDAPALRRHEQMHHQQRLRLGYWGFWVVCLWYYITVGYDNSPLEIEARSVE